MAAGPKPLELFDTPLKGAMRDQLRKVFKSNGLGEQRINDDYWVDLYKAGNVLEGASEFAAGYTRDGKFAYGRYTFPSHVDTQQVGKVVEMVTAKYGRPSSKSGNYGLGNVVVKWKMPQGMVVEVSRGWPDTTTYLSFSDTANLSTMNAEMDATQRSNTEQKAKAQGRAF